MGSMDGIDRSTPCVIEQVWSTSIIVRRFGDHSSFGWAGEDETS